MASRLWVPVACGPLARYAAGYGSWLAARGYSRWAVSHRLRQLDLLSRWLERGGFSPGELTTERVGAFLAARGHGDGATALGAKRPLLPAKWSLKTATGATHSHVAYLRIAAVLGP
jgi:hypothetical protein